ncbi:thiamine phosphate synthase [Chitinophagaceae bacterium LB-8]|uniref:Thiamine phosphate synthase n=1 Tax=Paraflavisolibacter caeni TaxID=2982496 RepID=A0A9X2XNG0_9BACT|nr:thiamine phosphate synthase [Paraflavisolibacter caeni]MCU7548114.1 thiamine phosphate synthase [Paraflavisolibacter caeni]
MLIVISDAAMIQNEAEMINALFNEGMEIFHLRKPEATASALQQLVEQVDPEHRSKISLHAHHHLASMLGTMRLHYTESKRRCSTQVEWQALQQGGFLLTTSIHQVEEADNLSCCFAYAFLGPVFNSISKQGYESTISKETKLPSPGTKLIAIGGIRENNLEDALQMGFHGVAILGSVWQNNDPVKSFRKIKKTWNSIVL